MVIIRHRSPRGERFRGGSGWGFGVSANAQSYELTVASERSRANFRWMPAT